MRRLPDRAFVCLVLSFPFAGCGAPEPLPTDASTVDASAADAGAGTTIGPAGGVVLGAGVTLTVPPGALASPVGITVTRTDEPIPPGYVGYSPVWRFAPAGLTFAVPATVQVTFAGDATRAGIFWSRASGSGYERLNGTVAGSTVVAAVTHFSLGFVGTEVVMDAGVADGGPAPDASTADATTDVTADATMDAPPPADAGVDVAAPEAGVAAAPRPVAPLPSASLSARRPTLRWALPVGTDGAHVDLCRDRAMTASCVAFDAAGASGAPAADLASGAWYWRLRGRTAGVTGGAAGPVWPFRIGLAAGATGATSLANLNVNGDAYDDLAVGDPTSNAVYVYLGGPTGLPTVPAATLAGAFGERFGSIFAAAGDVNGDGYGELVVSAGGAARLFLGGASGLSTTPAQTVGTAGVGPVAAAGDVDGDGYADVVLGVGNAAAVYYGSATGLVSRGSAPTCAVSGGCGGLVAGAGDVNADGFGDVLVGSGNRAQLHLGGATGLQPAASATLSDGSGGTFTNLGALADVNGDGFGDFFATSTISGTLVYHGRATGAASTPAVVVPPSEGLWFLPHPSRGGDVNGDGFADLVVPTVAGARVYPGSPSGVQTLPLSTSRAQYTHRSTAGDYNGDGYGDVVTSTDSNAIIGVFHGSAGGTPESATRTLTEPEPVMMWTGAVAVLGTITQQMFMVRGTMPMYCPPSFPLECYPWSRSLNTRFGAAVAAIGDPRGTNSSVTLFGAPGANAAYAVALGGAYDEGPLVGTLAGPPGSDFGSALASAGDVNGDNRRDVIVGAPNAARAYVYLGGTTFPGTPITLVGAAGSHFGRAVARARDLNGDGLGDVAVASDDRVDVFLGTATGVATTPAVTLTGPAGSRFGASIAGVGDLNRDGFRDLAVGAPGANAVYLYYGRAVPLPATPSATLSGAAGSEFGTVVSAAGDLDSNGTSDLLVGAPGASAVYFYGGAVGAAPARITTLSGAAGSRFGASVSRSGELTVPPGRDESTAGIVAAGAPGDAQPTLYLWECPSSNTCRHTRLNPRSGLPTTANYFSGFGATVGSQ